MILKKRKIKYAAIFFICWFAFLVFLVDGILTFQTLVDYFGSYALVEITLLLLVILPTLTVYKITLETGKYDEVRRLKGKPDKMAARRTKRTSKNTTSNVEQDQTPYTWCPLCRSHNVLYGPETSDGDCVCLDCGYTWNEFEGIN